MPYSADRWDTYKYMSVCFAVLSFLCASFVTKAHFSLKNGLRNMIPAFSFSYALTSIVLLFNILVDWNRDLHCYHDVVFQHKTPYCMATGALFNYGFLCGTTWTLVISLHLYLSVVKKVRKSDMQEYLKAMWAFAIGIPLVFCVVGLFNGAFGMETEFPLVFCWFTEKDDRMWYLSLFAIPTLIMSCLALLFMSLTFSHVTKTLMKNAEEEVRRDSQDEDDGDTNQDRQQRSTSTKSARDMKKEAKAAKKRWKKRLWYNQRTLIFILVFGVLSVGTSVIAIDLYAHEFDVEGEELDHYFHCLLGVNKTDDMSRQDMEKYPTQVCGHPDDEVSIWGELFFFIFWMQLLGVLPLLVYGAKGKLKQAWTVAKRIRATGVRLTGSSSRRFRGKNLSSVLPSVLEEDTNEYARRNESDFAYSKSRYRPESATYHRPQLSGYRIPSEDEKIDENEEHGQTSTRPKRKTNKANKDKKPSQTSSLKVKFVDSSNNSTDDDASGTGLSSTSGTRNSSGDHSSGDDLLSMMPIIGPFVNGLRRMRARMNGDVVPGVSGKSSGFDPEERQFKRLEMLEVRKQKLAVISSSHSEQSVESKQEHEQHEQHEQHEHDSNEHTYDEKTQEPTNSTSIEADMCTVKDNVELTL